MTADALSELAVQAAPPVLLPGAEGGLGQLAQLRWWAAAVRAPSPDLADAGPAEPGAAGGPFADPAMIVIGAGPGEVVSHDGSGAPALRLRQIPDLDAPGAPHRGAQAVDAAVDEGADLVLLVTGDQQADRLAALALVSVLCRIEPARLVSYDGARDDRRWMGELAALRDARRAAVRHRASPAFAAEALGSSALLGAAGAVLQAASRRTPVLLDGAVALAAAALAGALSTGVARWCLTSATGATGEAPVLQRLGLITAPPLPGGGAPGTAAILALRALQMALHSGSGAADPTMPMTAGPNPH